MTAESGPPAPPPAGGAACPLEGRAAPRRRQAGSQGAAGRGRARRPRRSAPLQRGKAPYSYIGAHCHGHRAHWRPSAGLTLGGIYKFITERFPSTATTPKKWQNSHPPNLTLNGLPFLKDPRRGGRRVRQDYWALDPTREDMFESGAFLRRRRALQAPSDLSTLPGYMHARAAADSSAAAAAAAIFPGAVPAARPPYPGAVYAGYAPPSLAAPPPVYYPAASPGPCRVFGLVPERPLSPELGPAPSGSGGSCAFASAGASATTTGYQPAGCTGARPANPSAYAAAYAGPDGAYPQGAGSTIFAAAGRLAGPASPSAGGSSGSVETAVDFYGRTSPGQFGALAPCYNPGGQLGGASAGAYHARHAAAYPGGIDRFVSAM
ncbi:PREDICTED: LOW QUALITY PROTEIN: forkhead box protein E1 [Rhinopithecus bieti]|uniref:LOW QUALITY PROTEIN: forkhead box protein E1 n=1 Tax=Rhinopithecus bieti TaxID=61621 RepID=UPI00083C437F|nr:PREDICTED: LOW QUALITY PROTEIN: forkhead box protein E1 [Rhinopithecus bieti]